MTQEAACFENRRGTHIRSRLYLGLANLDCRQFELPRSRTRESSEVPEKQKSHDSCCRTFEYGGIDCRPTPIAGSLSVPPQTEEIC